MLGQEYNIIAEWSRNAYSQATGDTKLEHVPARVQQLWDDFHQAYHLSNETQILELERILLHFQTNQWSA